MGIQPRRHSGNFADRNRLFTEGTHTIYLTVQDSDGEWSEAATRTVVVGDVPMEVIVDNGDPGTSFTGKWLVSSALNPWNPDSPAANSLYGRSGATYTWHAISRKAVFGEVTICGYRPLLRTTDVPVTIQHDGGTAAISVNQKQRHEYVVPPGDRLLLQFHPVGWRHHHPQGTQWKPRKLLRDAVKFVYFPVVAEETLPRSPKSSPLPKSAQPGETYISRAPHGQE